MLTLTIILVAILMLVAIIATVAIIFAAAWWMIPIVLIDVVTLWLMYKGIKSIFKKNKKK